MSAAVKHRGVFEDPKRRGVWWIHYHDAAGKRHRERVGKRQAAIDAYLERKLQIRGGTFTPPGRRDQIAFKDLLDLSLAQRKPRISPTHYAGEKWRSAKLIEMFGELRAHQITPAIVEEKFQRFLGSGITGSTVNRYRSSLSSVFTYAVKMGRLPVNPVARFQRYKENEARVRFLDAEEEASLRKTIRELAPDREPLFDLALHTGIRRGEQFKLRWENVDLERGILTVPGGTGSKTGRRFVQINPIAREAIVKLHANSNGSAFVSPGAKREGQRDWMRWFEQCVEESGVENFTWHDLRHTFASRLVMMGVDLSSVQKLLGHKSILMTQRYAHLSGAHLQAAVDKLTTAIKQPSGGRMRQKKVAQLF